MSINYPKKIKQAPVYDVAKRTPLERAAKLSSALNNNVLLKREDLQPIFSFKLRGAYNKIIHLSTDQQQCGVIAASAGNHAQGVALAAQRLNIPATIVMPRTTPAIKVDAVNQLGAKVILHGDMYDAAYQHAVLVAQEQQLTFIHPYDDPDVIAGQGTVGMEILEQHPENIDAIFVPVGGGGLIAGIAAYVKHVRPSIKIIGVEPSDAACMQQALLNKKRIILDEVGIFADGVAVKQVGKEPFRIASEFVDDVITVSSDEICAAIMDIFDDTRSINEPAGALAVAGLKKYLETENTHNQTLVAISSGANMNFDRLRYIAERAELGEQREAVFGVTIPEKPGSFHQFCHALGDRSITEFNYRFSDSSQAQVFVGVQLSKGKTEKQALFQQLQNEGYEFTDMSDNEMAKLHIRYMIGGHTKSANEHLYRFEFPERPGALSQFLSTIGNVWNISLFHYRNHGAAYGRVLMGIQVEQNEQETLHQFLTKLNYPYKEETDNPAYRQFLREA
ncbi:MAG: threonine ammonia-lyase, biosynthetic [Gammaproteobacteria bacterium]|nr:threonine ammonia-lyase, biosynthetic [Gammaproteobacteria bacterium]